MQLSFLHLIVVLLTISQHCIAVKCYYKLVDIKVADCRFMMASWRPDHSMLLSLLLDTVVGTKEMIAIRQDYCVLRDCLTSALSKDNEYFTGSKAEGLDLLGSDLDFMEDWNNITKIRVIQSFDENMDPSANVSTIFMSTENVPPGFALLEYLPQPLNLMNQFLYQACQIKNGIRYLSSDLIVQKYVHTVSSITPFAQKVNRQGPSAETWTPVQDPSTAGIDHVFSIHCPFWPNACLEWIHRPRQFGWPTSQDISSITDFGCHLVPIGHPHSKKKQMEWRLSFSIPERTLVRSFNHAQMQCYAVMKIILKEFIKVNCSPQNQVLCSYFIKTFLFWKYETTELNFWHENNLRECILYLLAEFSKCIQEGELRHYFIPQFNLLSVKLTRASQTELLQLFEIIIQSDISILKDCTTFQNVWSDFLQCRENKNNIISRKKIENLLNNDRCMMEKLQILNIYVNGLHLSQNVHNTCSQVLALSCKTSLCTLVLKQCLLLQHLSLQMHMCIPGNKGVYQLCRTAQNKSYSFDISTCKLWCAILLFNRGDFSYALNIINQMLSSIPPSVIYHNMPLSSTDGKQLYVDMFLNSDVTVIQKARKAWMFDLFFEQAIMANVVPLAIQIELNFSPTKSIALSPFTCAYYLQFLCYHRMQQYDNRDRALQQLIEVANNREQWGISPWISLNIEGHCLLLTGRTTQARDVFNRSHRSTQSTPYEILNSAMWYLLNCF